MVLSLRKLNTLVMLFKFVMKFAGKCEPDKEKINEFVEQGFDYFELYLNTTILDDNSVEEIVDVCKESDGEIVTVHTPHLNIDEEGTEYIHKTDDIAYELDATVIMDSNPLSTLYMPTVTPQKNIKSDVGYENDPSVSEFYLRVNHIGKGLPLVLDTAHLHMSEGEYLSFVEELISTHSDKVPAIHLAEGTRTNDGTPFNEGTVPLEEIVRMIYMYEYEGPVILETPQSSQIDALELVKEWKPDHL